jgi:hypothetical protein
MTRRVLSQTYSARWARAKRERERDQATVDAVSDEPIGIPADGARPSPVALGPPAQRKGPRLDRAYHCQECGKRVGFGMSGCPECGELLDWRGLA